MKIKMTLTDRERELLRGEMETVLAREPGLGLDAVFAYPDQQELALQRGAMLSDQALIDFSLCKRWLLTNQDYWLDAIHAFEGHPVGIIKDLVSIEELGEIDVPMPKGPLVAAAILLGVVWRRDYPMPEVRLALSNDIMPTSSPAGRARHEARMAELAVAGLVPATAEGCAGEARGQAA